MYYVFGLVVQTFFFGAYFVVVVWIGEDSCPDTAAPMQAYTPF
jgi:hypothetical protein